MSEFPPLFDLGQISTTPPAYLALVAAGQGPRPYLEQHRYGLWGQVSFERWLKNEAALTSGGDLVSLYSTPAGATLLLLTTADRQRTTVGTRGEFPSIEV